VVSRETNKRNCGSNVNLGLEIPDDGSVIADSDLNVGFRENLASLEDRCAFAKQTSNGVVMLLFLFFEEVQAPIDDGTIQMPQNSVAFTLRRPIHRERHTGLFADLAIEREQRGQKLGVRSIQQVKAIAQVN
jgi:hypothetical protein